MKKYLIKKLTLITVLFLLLFNISCDSDYPTQLSGTESIHKLKITHFLDGGEDDYADYNSAEQTIIKISLEKEDLLGTILELPANKTVKFIWTINPEVTSSQQPYLKTFDNQNVYGVLIDGKVYYLFRDEIEKVEKK